MSAIILNEKVRIPIWVRDFESFRRWTLSDSFPSEGCYSYLHDSLWADLSMETLVHNKIKMQVAFILMWLARKNRLGDFLGDRMRLICPGVPLSTEPDAMFLSQKSLEQQLVTLEEGDQSLEVIGTPDMVLEVVSKWSVEKDLVVLPELYYRAGIAEYWIVDSRPEHFGFRILRRGRGKYVAVRPAQGWIKSGVFGKSFKLNRTEGKDGVSDVQLEVR